MRFPLSLPFARRSRLAVLAGVVALILAVLRPEAAAAATDAPPLRVLTSFLPVHSAALAVAGDRARVENWLPPGIDPHDFQFSPGDLRRLRGADLLIVGGLGLEGWKEAHLREVSGNPKLRLIEAAADLPKEALIEDGSVCLHEHGHDHDHDHDHAHGGPNPHFWLDPLLMAHAVTNIAAALSQADPSGASVYQANAAAFVGRLQNLHGEFATQLKAHQGTPFITSHNAFPYLARRYGLRLVGVVEATAADEPSARAIADLSAVVKKEQARVLFTEPSPSRLCRRLARDLNLRLTSLDTLEVGDLGASAYEDGMRRNLRALLDGLAPARSR